MPATIERHFLDGDEEHLDLVLPGEVTLLSDALDDQMILVCCCETDSGTDVYIIDCPEDYDPARKEDLMGRCTSDTHVAEVRDGEQHVVDALYSSPIGMPSQLVMTHSVTMSDN